MIASLAVMFAVTFAQTASFTFVSRARNSGSVGYHAIASVVSNGVYLLVLRQVVTNLESLPLMVAYVVGSATGGIAMHVVALRWLERGSRRVGA